MHFQIRVPRGYRIRIISTMRSKTCKVQQNEWLDGNVTMQIWLLPWVFSQNWLLNAPTSTCEIKLCWFWCLVGWGFECKNVTGAGPVEAIVFTFLTGDTSVKPLLDIPRMMLYSWQLTVYPIVVKPSRVSQELQHVWLEEAWWIPYPIEKKSFDWGHMGNPYEYDTTYFSPSLSLSPHANSSFLTLRVF